MNRRRTPTAASSVTGHTLFRRSGARPFLVRRHAGQQPADEGATLLLVIGFIILISVTIGALVPFITTSLSGRNSLDGIRNRQYAADLMVEEAIATVRGMSQPGQTACGPFIRTGINGYDIRVDCELRPGLVLTGGVFVEQRNVRFTACLNTGVACTDSTAIIRAQVNYVVPTGNTVTFTYIQSWSVN